MTSPLIDPNAGPVLEIIKVAKDPRYYFSILPLLLAAAADLPFAEFQKIQANGKPLEEIANRLGFRMTSEASDKISTALAALFLDAFAYYRAPIDEFEQQTVFLLQNAVHAVQSLARQLRASSGIEEGTQIG